CRPSPPHSFPTRRSSDLTLLALVLSIGIVVDDAIVVLENVYHRIEQGEPPLAAAFAGTRQVAFAVVSTTLVVCAVFVPIMFISGDRKSTRLNSSHVKISY